MNGWRARAAAMVRYIEASGELRDPAWRDAFSAVPRHVFVPRMFRNDPTRGWIAIDDTDAEYPELVYAVDALITQLDADPESWEKQRRDGVYLGGWPSSSSSSPALMALMFEALDMAPGARVLEIGTGTGYNAAILCHRLGAERVTSIDVDPALIAAARSRLATFGYHPRLEAMDALAHIPDGPYDRLEVTVAIPRVPRAWIDQMVPGGIMLVNLTSGLLSDAMFKLVVRGDGSASGAAIRSSVYFMPTRAAHLPHVYEIYSTLDTGGGRRSTAEPPFTVTYDESSGFVTFLALAMRDTQRFLTDAAPTWNWLIATDGSWVHDLGDGTIEQGGPRDLWPRIDRLWRWWKSHGEPDRTRLGLTVSADGGQRLWLDTPGNIVDWCEATED